MPEFDITDPAAHDVKPLDGSQDAWRCSCGARFTSESGWAVCPAFMTALRRTHPPGGPPAPGRPAGFPTITCLCGSTRYGNYFHAANLRLTLAGEIVLSIGCDTKSDEGLLLTNSDKAALDALHLFKIDMADRVLVVSDPSGYFGDSTAREIRHALTQRKPVDFDVPAARERWERMSARRMRGSVTNDQDCDAADRQRRHGRQP